MKRNTTEFHMELKLNLKHIADLFSEILLFALLV